MGRKNVVLPFKLFDAVNMATATHTSVVTDTLYLDNIGLFVNWSGGTADGELIVEVSNDKDASPSNWTTLDFGNPISLTGASGSHIVNINQVPFAKMRIRYVEDGTATGNLTVTLVSKQVGG